MAINGITNVVTSIVAEVKRRIFGPKGTKRDQKGPKGTHGEGQSRLVSAKCYISMNKGV